MSTFPGPRLRWKIDRPFTRVAHARHPGGPWSAIAWRRIDQQGCADGLPTGGLMKSPAARCPLGRSRCPASFHAHDTVGADRDSLCAQVESFMACWNLVPLRIERLTLRVGLEIAVAVYARVPSAQPWKTTTGPESRRSILFRCGSGVCPGCAAFVADDANTCSELRPVGNTVPASAAPTW